MKVVTNPAYPFLADFFVIYPTVLKRKGPRYMRDETC